MQASKVQRGEITAFLSLIFLLLLSFSASIMDAASLQMTKNYKRADMERAMDSVFAEYHTELLEEFHVFAIEGSYERGPFAEERLVERLDFYGATNMEMEIEKLRLLTDEEGKEFRRQAVLFMKEYYGIGWLEEHMGTMDLWKDYEKEEPKVTKKWEDTLEEIGEEEKSQGAELPAQGNPIARVNELKKSSILSLVMPEGESLSGKGVTLEALPSKRSLKSGYGEWKEESSSDTVVESLLFGRYLLQHFSNAAEEKRGEQALDYELEYLLEGKESDQENLERVVKKLIGIRFLPNYLCLQGSVKMRAEAEAMALSLCTAAALPMLTEAVTQALLLGWAYGESIVDVRSLLGGYKVSLIKLEQDWQLSLSGLLKLGTREDQIKGKDTSGGLAYSEYLWMLFSFQNKNTVTMRSLDLVELRMKLEKKMEWFQADACVCKVELYSLCPLRKGIQYEFMTEFGYQ